MSEETPTNSITTDIGKLLTHAEHHSKQLGTVFKKVDSVEKKVAEIGVKVARNTDDIADNRTDIKDLAAAPHCDPPPVPPPPKPTIKDKLKLKLGPLSVEGTMANVGRFVVVTAVILLLLKSHGVDIFKWIAKLFQ